MRYGMCIGGDVSKIEKCKNAGYDYVESCFSLLAEEKEAENYDRFSEELKRTGMTCESVNCFIPGSLKTTGDDINYDALAEYIDRGMKKGEQLGVKTVVFGSGGSKSVPEGFSHGKAFCQLVYFLREIVSPIASKYGITVVVEPLCDCNIIQRVKEGVYLAAAADKDNVKGLGDLFHMINVGDTPEDIRICKGSVHHAHIAEPVSRHYPTDPAAYDYKSFIDALEYAGCERCSVEAGTDDFDNDCAAVMKMLKNL